VRALRIPFSLQLRAENRFPLFGIMLYGPARSNLAFQERKHQSAMRAETEKLVDEIRQAISLLRRHL
jgi:hypothetical protein